MASNILKDHPKIVFKILGDGQTRPEIEKLIEKNNSSIKLLGIVPKEKLLECIKKSDVCLGIFGDTLKAQKVVTNKVFQILASQKPLITMKSPASLEAHLEDKKNCILVPPSNPKKLVEAILFLKNNPERRQEIAEEGYITYTKYLSMNAAGKKLVSISKKLIDK